MAGAQDKCWLFVEVLVSLFLPPLGVVLHFGCCGLEFFICLLLTLLGYLPGMIYAVYVLVTAEEDPHSSQATTNQ